MVKLPVEVVLLRVSEAGQAVAGLRCGCVVGHDWMFLGDSVWMRECDGQGVEASENKGRMQEKSTGSCFQLFFIKAEASTTNVQALGLERRKRRDFLKTLQDPVSPTNFKAGLLGTASSSLSCKLIL